MTPDFLIQFVINRLTGVSHILLTDATINALSIKGNFYIAYPDGSVSQYTDFNSPNISSIGGSFQAPLLENSEGEVQRGTYTFIYTVIDTDADTVESNTKTFSFSFDEPEIEITSTSDVAVPRVAFSVPFDTDQTNYTETSVAFNLQCQFPSTSDASATTLSKTLSPSDRELLMIDVVNYYEGVYSPLVDFNSTYQSVSEAYLSVSYVDQKTSDFSIYQIKTSTELLDDIETFKESESCNKEIYNRIMALFSNIGDNVREGNIDEGNELLSELYSLLGFSPSGAFQSGPITGLTFASGDLSNYYTKTEVDVIINNLLSSLGLTRDITVSVDGGGLGGYDFLEVITTGTAFTDVWEGLLRSASPAVYTSPTISLSGSNFSTGNKTTEVGTSESIILSPVFNQNNAGDANQFVLDKNSSPLFTDTTSPIPDASYPDSFTAAEGSIIYNGDLSHDQGPVLNDSLGDPDPTGQIAAGTITSNNVTYNIVYPWFFGVSSTDTLSGSDIYSGTKVIEVIGSSIQAAFSGTDFFLWFAVPSSNNNPKTYSSWQSSSDANNAGSIGGGGNLFGSPTTISVTSTGLAANWTIDYDLYVTNFKTIGTTLNLS